MLDLNTLIPPGSGLQLTNAININDRGEILAKSLPLGVTPIDDRDLGHLVLLIPCEADDQYCGEDIQSNEIQPSPPGLSTEAVASALPRLPRRPKTMKEGMAAWRARLARQFQIPVVGPER
jgi:hypothetical protein